MLKQHIKAELKLLSSPSIQQKLSYFVAFNSGCLQGNLHLDFLFLSPF